MEIYKDVILWIIDNDSLYKLSYVIWKLMKLIIEKGIDNRIRKLLVYSRGITIRKRKRWCTRCRHKANCSH